MFNKMSHAGDVEQGEPARDSAMHPVVSDPAKAPNGAMMESDAAAPSEWPSERLMKAPRRVTTIAYTLIAVG